MSSIWVCVVFHEHGADFELGFKVIKFEELCQNQNQRIQKLKESSSNQHLKKILKNVKFQN